MSSLSAATASSSLPEPSPLEPCPLVRVIPILDDNFCYCVRTSPSTGVLVDPAAASASQILSSLPPSLTITHILTTHKHWDHAGGNNRMLLALNDWNKDVVVVGGAVDKVEACTLSVNDGQKLTLGDLTVTCIHTPGHTQGHICYYVVPPPSSSSPSLVFTGDTLFVGGCGKLFEGTASDMQQSLSRLASLPPSTQVYCGHEYTSSNYRFAMSVVDEDSADGPTTRTTPGALLKARHAWALAQGVAGLHTVPSTVEEEIRTNVFVRAALADTEGHDRCDDIRRKAGLKDGATAAELLGALRTMKNNYK